MKKTILALTLALTCAVSASAETFTAVSSGVTLLASSVDVLHAITCVDVKTGSDNKPVAVEKKTLWCKIFNPTVRVVGLANDTIMIPTTLAISGAGTSATTIKNQQRAQLAALQEDAVTYLADENAEGSEQLKAFIAAGKQSLAQNSGEQASDREIAMAIVQGLE